MKGYKDDIEKQTEDNTDFRRVVYTGHNLQLVLMSIEPGDEGSAAPADPSGADPDAALGLTGAVAAAALGVARDPGTRWPYAYNGRSGVPGRPARAGVPRADGTGPPPDRRHRRRRDPRPRRCDRAP